MFLIGTEIPDPKLLYQVYCYLHIYSNRDHCKATVGCHREALQNKVLPALHYLASVMNEIHWDARLSPNNHSPHFPVLFTGIVDTFPIRVLKPVNSTLRKALFNPKYDDCVYKVQLGINFLGEIVLCTGPHLGVCYDGHIWERTAAKILTDWEFWIGDGAYPFCNVMFVCVLCYLVCVIVFFDCIQIYLARSNAGALQSTT